MIVLQIVIPHVGMWIEIVFAVFYIAEIWSSLT